MTTKMLIVGNETQMLDGLRTGLVQHGFVCSFANDDQSLPQHIADQAPDLLLVAMDGFATGSQALRIADGGTLPKETFTIVLLSRRTLDQPTALPEADDFVIEPWDACEVALRAKRLLRRNNGADDQETIECGDLVIDLSRCEVRLRGEVVPLTFREYELLRFLAANKGRVFTREALLNRVWGYDYFGGDRTVDVHIRRLRSKLEHSGCDFIDTVRHIGYKFRAT